MPVYSTHQAKTHLSELIRMVERGELITITRGGLPVALLWWLARDGRLDLALVHRIKLPRQHVYVSVASAWEICALEREGQVSFGKPARDCLPTEISMHRFEWLPIDYRHVFLAQQLPRTDMDPYDRLILAQASVEGLALVTTSDRLRAPGVEIVAARSPHAAPRLRASSTASRPSRVPSLPPRESPLLPLPGPSRRPPRPPLHEPSRRPPIATSIATGTATSDSPDDRPIPQWNALPWGASAASGGGPE